MADENKDRKTTTSGGMEPGRSGTTAGAAGATGTAGSTAASGQTTDRPWESGAGMASSARHYASDVASRAKDKGRSMFEQQKESALGQVDSVAQAIRSSAGNLQGEGQDHTARYVHMIADQLESIGNRLRDKNLDTLVQDAQNLARRAPGTFIVGSMVAGFLLARFLKSSNEREYRRYGIADEDQRVLAAGEAGPYVGAAGSTGTTGTARNVGADGTPGTATGTATTGLGSANLGGGTP